MAKEEKSGCFTRVLWILLTASIGVSVNYIINNYVDLLVVPDVVNKPEKRASAIIKGVGFNQITYRVESGGIEGNVVYQVPPPGTRQKRDAQLTLWVQSGPSNNTVSTPASKRVSLPQGTPIEVKLPRSITVDGQAPPPSYEAQLSTALDGGSATIAAKGAPITLDVSSTLDPISTTVRLSIRECRLVDGRTLYVRTEQHEFRNAVTFTQIALYVICGILIGALMSPLWLDITGLSGAVLGFFIGLMAVSVAVYNGKKVDIPADTAITFHLADSAQVDLK